MKLESANRSDEHHIKKLLERCELPHEDITGSLLEHFFVVRQSGKIIGVVGVEIYDRDALVRSLAVAESHRGKGIGETLVRCIEDYALVQNADRLYLLTTTADGYFSRFGYHKQERKATPKKILETTEFTSLCPSSASLMFKLLNEN